MAVAAFHLVLGIYNQAVVDDAKRAARIAEQAKAYNAEHVRKVEAAQAEHERRVAQLITEHQRECQELEAEYQQRVRAYQDQLADLVRQERQAERNLSPSCVRRREAAVYYRGFRGSVHTFDFACERYGRLFETANQSKVC